MLIKKCSLTIMIKQAWGIKLSPSLIFFFSIKVKTQAPAWHQSWEQYYKKASGLRGT